MAMYCGDEVCAVVADLGHATCRFGQAGQDSPRHVFRADIGRHKEEGRDKYVLGDSALRVLRNEMDIVDYFSKDSPGDINWDATEALLRYGLDSCLLHVDQKDYPLLLAENFFHSALSKDVLLEMIFEKFDIPATYICHNATLSSFASGRPTGLVVDLGASASRCVPIVDGYALRRSSVETHRGGFYFDQVLAEALHFDFNSLAEEQSSVKGRKRSRSSSIDQVKTRMLIPWYESCGTLSVALGDDAVSNSKTKLKLTSSFRRMHCLDTIRDIRHWMCFVPRVSRAVPDSMKALPTTGSDCDGYDVPAIIASIPPYELPDGTIVEASNDASLCIENHLFNPSFSSGTIRKNSRVVHNLMGQHSNAKERSTLHNGEYLPDYDDEIDLAGLVMQSILKADVDTRKELLGNILVVGGGALTDGIIPRLQSDVTKLLPSHMKCKVVSSLLPVERHHAAWLGGSILGICGSFQQLWISRDEYQEYGPTIHRQRCNH